MISLPIAGTPMQQQGSMMQVPPMMGGELTLPPGRQLSHMVTPQFSVSTYVRSYVLYSCIHIRTYVHSHVHSYKVLLICSRVYRAILKFL